MNRDVHAVKYIHVRTRCTSASDHILCLWYLFFRVKTALLGQFSPTACSSWETVAPCVSNRCRSPWIASLEERVSASSAHKRYKQRSLWKPAPFEATCYHVQHKVGLHVEVARHRWMGVSAGTFLSAGRQCLNSTAAPVAEQREHSRGHRLGFGDLSVM